MDLKVLHCPAGLAPPSAPFKDLPAQLLVAVTQRLPGVKFRGNGARIAHVASISRHQVWPRTDSCALSCRLSDPSSRTS
jgi:hypothetical protein